MIKHGHTKGNRQSKEYRTYHAMLKRCYDAKNKEYRRYGRKGISVCPRWRGKDGFVLFLSDMGHAPSKKHTLDRIDGTKGYSPENCRWATRLEQVRNRGNTKQYLGKPMAQWAEELEINYYTLMDRWRAGDRGEKLFRPVGKTGNRTITPEKARTIFADPRPCIVLAHEYGVSDTTISRIKRRVLWASETTTVERRQ